MSRYIDLMFPATGQNVPLDHGYLLFSALCRALPQLHGCLRWGVHPIWGERTTRGILALGKRSFVKLRMPAEDAPLALELAQSELKVGNDVVRLGFPQMRPLEPSAVLKSRYVTIKGFEGEVAEFAEATRRQVAKLPGLSIDPERIAVAVGPRRVARIRGKAVVGFAMLVEGLDADSAIAFQVHGIGGRRRMGAGIFVPPGRAA